MLNALQSAIAIAVAITAMTSCRPALSEDEAMVVGQWQIMVHTAVWRYKFASDHTLTLSLPHDDSVNANERHARFDVVDSGTWRVDGSDVVYTLKAEGSLPERTTRISLAELGQHDRSRIRKLVGSGCSDARQRI